MPQFKSKIPGLLKYLKEQIKYPQEALSRGIEGSVLVTFIVNTDSTISDVEIMGRKLGSGIDEEALSVVWSTDGMWIPGKENGEAVKVRMNLPINFSIEGNSKNDVSNSSINYFNMAQWALENQEYNDAIEGYLKCVENDYYSNLSKYNIGVCYYRKDDFRSALKIWHQLEAIDYKRKFEEIGLAYFGWGNEKLHQEEYPIAISFYTKALEYLPNDENIFYNRGIAYLKTGLKDQACMDWHSAKKKGSKEVKELINNVCQK